MIAASAALFFCVSAAANPADANSAEMGITHRISSAACALGNTNVERIARNFAAIQSHAALRSADNPTPTQVSKMRKVTLALFVAPSYLKQHGLDPYTTEWNSFSGNHQLLCVKKENQRTFAIFGVSRVTAEDITWGRIYQVEVVTNGDDVRFLPSGRPTKHSDVSFVNFETLQSF